MGKRADGEYREVQEEGESSDTPEPKTRSRGKVEDFEITISGAGIAQLLQTSAAVAAKSMHLLGKQLDNPRVYDDPDTVMKMAAQATGYQLDLLKVTASIISAMKDKSGRITAFSDVVLKSIDDSAVSLTSSPPSGAASRLGRLVSGPKS